MNTPLVSFVLTAFRHAKYIDAAVTSCLAQTVRDIEVIVVDDGSNDGTVSKLSRIDDPRLVVVQQENAGPSIATNRGLSLARGRFVALMSGDDVCLPDRLETQIASMADDAFDAVFARPVLIDEDGGSLPESSFPQFFEQRASTSSGELFRALFLRRNFLCAPAALLRRSAIIECGVFQPALYQLQDFHMWLRLCSGYRVRLTDDRVVAYRLRDAGGNLSNDDNLPRTNIEYSWIYHRLLQELDSDTMTAAFGSDLQLWGVQDADADTRRILVFMLHPEATIRRYALERLVGRFDLLREDQDRITFGDIEVRARELAKMLLAVA